jgi:hypothetical protein
LNLHTRDITLSAAFIASGLLIPLLFHTIGLGATLLPMFWSVAVAGFFLPAPAALLTGILTPPASFLISGMPPPPVLYKMIFELGTLGLCIALLVRNTRLGGFWIVLSGLAASLGAGLVGSACIAPLLGLPPAFYAAASLVQGLPGIAVMLILIPLLIFRLLKIPALTPRKPHDGNP